MTRTVSALVPFYGDPDPALMLIEQLRAQSTPPLEIIVIDDVSPTPFPDVQGVEVLTRHDNGGFGSAVNTGARAASGDLLLVLNSDLTLGVRTIEDLIAATESWQPTVASPLLREGDRLTSTARHWPTIRGTFFSWLTPLARIRDRGLWRRLVGHWDPSQLQDGGHVDWLVGACLLIPRVDFLRVGGFDERFHMNSEEIDLQRRLSGLGIPSRVIVSVEVGHLGGGSSDPALRRQWLVTSLFTYFDKWGGARRLLFALSLASLVNLVWNSLRRIKNVAVAPLATFSGELTLVKTGFLDRRVRLTQGEQ